MDLRQLRVFLQVAEMRSITRAAAVLHIAQPAVSRHVRQLEEEISVKLFERHERGVTLTDEGKELLQRATRIVRDFDDLRGDLLRRSTALTGHVRLGVAKSLVELLIAPAVSDFARQHATITLTVMEGTTLELREQLATDRLDIAIVSDLDATQSARMQPMAREPILLVARKADGLSLDHPLSIQEVASGALAVPNRPNVIRLTLDGLLGEAGLVPQIGLETNSPTIIHELARRGRMRGVMPYSAAAPHLRRKTISAAPIRGASLSWMLLATPLRELSRPAQALHDWLLQFASTFREKREWKGLTPPTGTSRHPRP